MQELKKLFIEVRSFDASCRMDSTQTELYYKLNKVYRDLSGTKLNYSVCSKKNLLLRVEEFITNAENN